jgi:hypothetical protein
VFDKKPSKTRTAGEKKGSPRAIDGGVGRQAFASVKKRLVPAERRAYNANVHYK